LRVKKKNRKRICIQQNYSTGQEGQKRYRRIDGENKQDVIIQGIGVIWRRKSVKNRRDKKGNKGGRE
jgi:hypothetical protein